MTHPMPPDEFRIEQRPREDGAVVVSVFGDLDLATCPQLDQTLSRLAAAKRFAVLELIGVEFMDSTGLNLLIQATREARRDGWSFAIRPELPDTVARLFELTGMNGHLPFDETP
ncbi:MAG TPA: STAS domain-containing protein [Baekduia sp.]|jgi:anti-anti-sigma factor|nr:STAS domain-containing protein [Baekduia sp.]